MERSLHRDVRADLERKMVFLGGPRQCGKTTLAKAVLSELGGRYLNWDFDDDRREIIARGWSKFPRWKNWLKGLYDTRERRSSVQRYLVIGSARLDVHRRGGDSLLGRYHHYRLHPLSLGETPPRMKPAEALRRLLTVGGFPEPFLDGDEREARRWRRERFDRVLRDDVRDLEPLRDIQTLALFVDALRARVGSTIVLSNIASDLQVAPKTLAHWLDVLERMYLVFVVRPYTQRLPRAIRKPPKVYFFDNCDVLGGELRYLRDKEGREVDFVALRDGAIEELVEAKWAETRIAPALGYYAERLLPKSAVQIVANLPARAARRHGSLALTSALDVAWP